MDRSGFARGTLAPRAGMTRRSAGAGRARAAHDERHGHEPWRAWITCADGSRGHADGAATHAAESGPIVDMRADMPNTRLDDPGVGLRDNGRRVLTYADLARSADRSTRASRRARSSCTSPATWNATSGRSTARSSRTPKPLQFTHGERLRIALVNDTMMTHPIHLHGMWSEIVGRAAASSWSASTRSRCSRRSASPTGPRPTRSVAGPITATCSITWKRACSARSSSHATVGRVRARFCVVCVALLAGERSVAAEQDHSAHAASAGPVQGRANTFRPILRDPPCTPCRTWTWRR